MTIYTATITDDTGKATETGVMDYFQIQAPLDDTGKGYLDLASDLRIREIRLGQYSDPPAATAEEILQVRLIVYNGDTGEGGDTGTTVLDTGNGIRRFPVPVNMNRGSSARPGLGNDTGTAIRVVTACNKDVSEESVLTDTGVATAAALTKTVYADTWNIAAGWWYYPPEEEMLVVRAGDALAVRVSAPADTITINGTMVFETYSRTNNRAP